MAIADHCSPPETPSLPMGSDLFEDLARQAYKADRILMEMFSGRIWTHKATDGAHAAILSGLIRTLLTLRTDLETINDGLGLQVGGSRQGRTRPDGVLVPAGHFDGAAEWVEPDEVRAVVEVTSRDADTHARDRVEKPGTYAATGIGTYLLVDRDAEAVVVHSRPGNGQYLDRSIHPYGEDAPVPGLGVTLETKDLKRYAH